MKTTMTMRDKFAAIIHANTKQALSDHDVANDVIRNDPEIYESDRATANAILAALPDMVPGWQPIETAPRDDTCFLAWCPPCPKFPDGRMMIWSGKMLFVAMGPIPNHLQFPATMWQPLVPPVTP